MAATSIEAQLQALRAAVHVSDEPEPGRRRPFTRASILFDAKEAADIDLDTIFTIAVSGLEDLIAMEDRFRNYKTDLFSQQSKDLDRELVGQEENRRIDASIGAYLRLLSGYLEMKSALRSLEYLVRRYKVHVFNKDDLILCALPYHDTHVFVQIMRLIDTRNSRWKFLDGVKASGARIPRDIIVQQCIRDLGVLEAICDYATPQKKIQPSKHLIGFCTAVIFEVLGCVTITSNMVKIILPYLSSGLKSGSGGLNQKAAAMMIVSVLAQKASLSSHVTKSLLHLVADVARADAKEGNSLQMLRMSLMTLINIVQLQHVGLIPKKTIDVLIEIRGFLGILAALNNEFNIDNLIAVLVDSLLEHSDFEDTYSHTLLSLMETAPVKDHVQKIVYGLLTKQMKASSGKINSEPAQSGNNVKQALTCLSQKYPNEFRGAFFSFLKKSKTKKINSSYVALCKILDEYLSSSDEVLDPKLLFALQDSKPEIRRSAIINIDTGSILREKTVGSKKFDGIQDALLQRLYDEDLNVALAVLSLDKFSDIISSPLLIEPIQHILQRCTAILISSSAKNRQINVALACLQQIIRNLKNEECYSIRFSVAIFPLLLVRPKTQLQNFKALELASELNWPFFKNLILAMPGEEADICLSSMNFENVSKLGENFSAKWEEYMPWLVECCKSHHLSKTLFFLMVFQSLKILKKDVQRFLSFFVSCFPIMKAEWEMLEPAGVGISRLQVVKKIMDSDCLDILDVFLEVETKDLNYGILACLLLRLLKALAEVMPDDESLDVKVIWFSALRDLFLFFANHSKDVFSRHLEFLFSKCKTPLISMMLKMITEEGVHSATHVQVLHSLARISSEDTADQLFLNFPSLFVPLSSDTQSVREAAMSCIQALLGQWSHISNNGNREGHLRFLGELLGLIIQHKKMIISDANVLFSLLTSLLGSSSGSLLVQSSIEKRFDDSTKNEMLFFIVKHALVLPANSKLKLLSLIKGVGSKLISIPLISSMLDDLLESFSQHCTGHGGIHQKMSQNEIDILCLLLEICCQPSSHELNELENFILKTLWVTGSEYCVISGPSIAVLRNLNPLYGDLKIETKELIFSNLLNLLRNKIGDVQNYAKETLLQLNVECSVVQWVLDSIVSKKSGLAFGKKKRKIVKHSDTDHHYDPTQNKENALALLSCLLDVLLTKENIENRTSLIQPLLELLCLTMKSDEWMPEATEMDGTHAHCSDSSHAISSTTISIQKTLLLVLEKICASVGNDTPPKGILKKFDLQLVISWARTSTDAVTRNRIFSFITALVRIMPDVVLRHKLDILDAVGESTSQWDSYSRQVLEGLISAIIPCWLSKTNDMGHLLQIFVTMLPKIAQHRRVPIVAHIVRTLGEDESLGLLLFLLFQFMIKLSLDSNLSSNHSIDDISLNIKKQWEYEFAQQLCGSYSCTIWLPSLAVLLKKFEGCVSNDESYMQLLAIVLFIEDKLQDPEISHMLELEDDVNFIQCAVGEVIEQIVCHQQMIESTNNSVGVPNIIRNELKIFTRGVLRTLMKGLPISLFLKVITKLLHNDKGDVRKKALQLFCENMKDLAVNKKIERKGPVPRVRKSLLHLSEASLALMENLCLETLKIFDAPDDVSNISIKITALSALEVLAVRFPMQDRVFGICLGCVSKRICSSDPAIASHCLLTTGALVNALGLRALPELPNVMQSLLEKSSGLYLLPMKLARESTTDSASSSAHHAFTSILQTLMSVTDKLSGFLNPYMGDMLRLVVLHPLLFSQSELKLRLKADALRDLIIGRIPVRILLPPLLTMYMDAVNVGEKSVSTLFIMLEKLVSSMDRASIAAYHAKVFDLCLVALDLRHQKHTAIQNIDVVEQKVLDAFVALTMKLTEPMFRPLFIKIVEWSNSSMDDSGQPDDRAISFFSLVNKLAESHRSLFVPYFKWLLDGCIKGLGGSDDTKAGPFQKKRKKARNNSSDNDFVLSLQNWRLRALILTALHYCFLYDTGSPKFLDSSNFQVLMKPIVSQLIVDPPEDIENHPNVPSLKEVDDLLVVCVGQMAVTADSDLLWKPLNHEVLMQTRSEKLRPRILGLRIVKYMVDNLRDGYMAFLAETIPFLSELLEDSDDSVKALAQEVRLEMEAISGESLKEYL